jgi:MFS family permease
VTRLRREATGRTAVTLVFFTVFLDLVGFGIVLPLLPFYATELGASALAVGLIISSYSAMQFLFSPVWGSLSDHHGRRPLLILGLLGSSASYVIFGLAHSVTVLLLSRVVAGIMGANIPVAQAFIADSTSVERRARGMGLIGAAFGLGFIFGPAIGGFLSRWGYGVPGFFAAGTSFLAASAAFLFLPESLSPEKRTATTGHVGMDALRARVRSARRILHSPRLRDPITVFFLGTMGFAGFTTTFPLFLDDPLHLDAVHAGGMFALVGIFSATIQGGAIGPLVERFGEKAIAFLGGVLLGLGVAAMGILQSVWVTYVALLPVGLGWGMLAPSLQSLVSRRASDREQGEVLGVNQSASAVARVIGPVAAGWLFGVLGAGPGFVAGALLVFAAAAYVRLMPSIAGPDEAAAGGASAAAATPAAGRASFTRPGGDGR